MGQCLAVYYSLVKWNSALLYIILWSNGTMPCCILYFGQMGQCLAVYYTLVKWARNSHKFSCTSLQCCVDVALFVNMYTLS